MRRAYVKCILKQDIGWFDEHPAGQLPTAVTANMAKVQDGLGRKVGDIVLNGVSGEFFFFGFVDFVFSESSSSREGIKRANEIRGARRGERVRGARGGGYATRQNHFFSARPI